MNTARRANRISGVRLSCLIFAFVQGRNNLRHFMNPFPRDFPYCTTESALNRLFASRAKPAQSNTRIPEAVMDATYIFLCGIRWARSEEESAGLELIRATSSSDPEVRVLAQAMLQQAGDRSKQLIGKALSQAEMSAVQAAFTPSNSRRDSTFGVLPGP
jgi:hypothetical protein